jgi:hypothetical protein
MQSKFHQNGDGHVTILWRDYFRYHDNQHNDISHNDTQDNGIQHNDK